MAEKFNKYFTNVATDLITSLKNRKNTYNCTTNFDNNSQNKVCFNKFDPITHTEIFEAISKLKNGSSPGLDKISSDLLKKHSLTFCKPLSHIFNLCISQNKVPDAFKVAIITPIHKKSLISALENFRPISVISNIAKTFEKILKKKLIFYLESNNLLFEYQFGFRPHRSTDQAIANVTKLIYTALDEGKKCAAIYLDLAKVFDTVDHDKLLSKTQNIGITGSALSLIKSYLENRKQRVKINSTISNENTIKCGVPQGTTLSPVLFNIHLNDIKLLKLNSKIVCYADDTVLICIGSSWNEVFQNIEVDLKSIHNWLSDNSLFLNLNKSTILLHSLSEQTLPPIHNIKIHDSNCNTLDSCSYI